ncbi:isoprenylcysteine carboxylmethyltransferase family protein [Bradyrhizobium arachidis]|uniref:methyltransferase family protein n=1 Tax=Bradyrhizobium arachidis TaxID=858423 RepID=UPI0021611C36|nr:isoprenylcysteine carboxylmethyltransferase family protein [Bradyrhizobium arachidis]UVO39410.1 isoprenylcysteine carboxylmethyltransferase family protein [Bradyrhizobium arachidis]
MEADEAATELSARKLLTSPAFLLEWSARISIVAVFAALAILNLVGLYHQLPIENGEKVLPAAARLANVMFLILVAATALTRLSPILKARGIEPRVSALSGTFFCVALALLPRTELGPVLSMVSTTLIMVGAVLSFIVLRWLGRSFSILAEARQLVTSGPYRFVRHPLYVCEAIALLGVCLQVISPLAVVITLSTLLIQYRRMINEEVVLTSAFPEYRGYAARTPRIVPAPFTSRAWSRGAVQGDTVAD